MEIVIASTIVPFVEGGGTFIVDWLEQTLKDRGHSVFVLKIPFHSDFREMADQMLGLRLLDIRDYGERMIAIRPPSHLLRHPNKVLWFIHHHRTAYDLWDSPYREFPDNSEGHAYRNLLFSTDMLAFCEARNIFTNSRVVANRLLYFNNIRGQVLYPPLIRPERYVCRSYGDTFLYVSRLVHHKRQYLALESMRFTRTPVKLVIAGKAEVEAYGRDLAQRIQHHGLTDRVTLMDNWISEKTKQDLFADCLGCIYIPLDEDSYGYPTLEAFQSSKPVITTIDAGGTLEIILDGVNGFVTSPTPEALAEAMDTLYTDRDRAQRMGISGRQRLDELGIGWDHVIESLLR